MITVKKSAKETICMFRTGKRLYLIFCTAAAAILIFSVVSLKRAGELDRVRERVKSDAAEMVIEKLDDPDMTVVIRERDGKLCILTHDGRLIADTGIGADLIPDPERARLKEGISIKASDLAEYLRQKKAVTQNDPDTGKHE